ncbi:hypothetical protein C4K18_2743 [Pseudomonas chlororaphis subsp. aurantiaca]|nr:hypothetical protein C4K18_2743 [Pseudomonas chlororaphis subsp. aurantiaca]
MIEFALDLLGVTFLYLSIGYCLRHQSAKSLDDASLIPSPTTRTWRAGWNWPPARRSTPWRLNRPKPVRAGVIWRFEGCP